VQLLQAIGKKKPQGEKNLKKKLKLNHKTQFVGIFWNIYVHNMILLPIN